MAHILVIDDQASARDAIRAILEPGGHVIDEAGNGCDAIRKLNNRYDLVITDILMPEMDGLELIRYIKGSHLSCRIIVITGGFKDQSIDLLSYAKAFGADDTLSKASVITELAGMVSKLLTPAMDEVYDLSSNNTINAI
jgi:CheY-like chemotaxis protein